MISFLHEYLWSFPKFLFRPNHTILISCLNEWNYDVSVYLYSASVYELKQRSHYPWRNIRNCNLSFTAFNKWTKQHFLKNIWTCCQDLSVSKNSFLVWSLTCYYYHIREFFRKQYVFEVLRNNRWIVYFIVELWIIYTRKLSFIIITVFFAFFVLDLTNSKWWVRLHILNNCLK
jgi:hypothetical protein